MDKPDPSAAAPELVAPTPRFIEIPVPPEVESEVNLVRFPPKPALPSAYGESHLERLKG